MILYIVLQEACYAHDIKGIYSSRKKAQERVDFFEEQTRLHGSSLGADFDGYHEYVIYEIKLDEDVNQKTGGYAISP